jgi:hypothetical protein
MKQRGGVDVFKNGGETVDIFSVVPAKVRGEDEQKRSKSLALAQDTVPSNLLYEGHPGTEGPVKLLVNSFHMFFKLI